MCYWTVTVLIMPWLHPQHYIFTCRGWRLPEGPKAFSLPTRDQGCCSWRTFAADSESPTGREATSHHHHHRRHHCWRRTAQQHRCCLPEGPRRCHWTEDCGGLLPHCCWLGGFQCHLPESPPYSHCRQKGLHPAITFPFLTFPRQLFLALHHAMGSWGWPGLWWWWSNPSGTLSDCSTGLCCCLGLWECWGQLCPIVYPPSCVVAWDS